jgi:hypothetical protein
MRITKRRRWILSSPSILDFSLSIRASIHRCRWMRLSSYFRQCKNTLRFALLLTRRRGFFAWCAFSLPSFWISSLLCVWNFRPKTQVACPNCQSQRVNTDCTGLVQDQDKPCLSKANLILCLQKKETEEDLANQRP